MREIIIAALKVILMLGISMTVITLMYVREGKTHTPETVTVCPEDTTTIIPEPSFYNKPVDEGLIEAINFYDIQHPDIVYAQAILETGYFKSTLCLKHNNLFGLYNSKAKRYCRFDNWTESVVAYKEWIQERYKPPEDYYEFLNRIHYAEDPKYTQKLRQIVKRENDKRRYTKGDSIP